MLDVLTQAVEAQLAVEEIEQLRAKLLKERRELVLAAHAQGHTHEEIAQKFGLTKQRIARIISGNAPPKTRRPRKWPAPVEL